MRTTPRVGSKLWFGPKRWAGWGWSPVSVEGWLVTLAAVAAVVAPLPFLDEDAAPWPYLTWVLVAAGVLVLVAYLKGTSPGGPRAFQQLREGATDG